MKITNKRGTFSIEVSDAEFAAEVANCQHAAYRGTNETPESCARGRLLSHAMHMQALRNEAAEYIEPTAADIRAEAIKIVIDCRRFEAIKRHGRYNAIDLFQRATSGRRLSEGMAAAWAGACVYGNNYDESDIARAMETARANLSLRRDYIRVRTGA